MRLLALVGEIEKQNIGDRLQDVAIITRNCSCRDIPKIDTKCWINSTSQAPSLKKLHRTFWVNIPVQTKGS